MNKIPPTQPVVDANNTNEASEGSVGAPPTPEILRSFVYREPTGLPPEDDDSHPHRRRTDRIPHK